MKLEPYGQRVIVKRNVEERSAGGIILPDDSQKTGLLGVVIHKGPDCDFVNKGDTILFARFSGFELPLEGEYRNYLVMNEEDILARANAEEELKNVG